MATRAVTGTIRRANDTPWAGATVRFRLNVGDFTTTPAATYPLNTISVVTESDGTFEVQLVSGLASTYTVEMPEGETFEIIVDDGGATTLETLRLATAGASIPLATVEGVINDLIAAGVGVTTIQVGDVTLLADPDVIDFDAAYFSGAVSPAGEVNITLAQSYQLSNAKLSQIAALADPNVDAFLGWDDSANAGAGALILFTLGAGLATAGTVLNVAIDPVYTRRTDTAQACGATSLCTRTFSCSAGEVAIAGGYTTNGVQMHESGSTRNTAGTGYDFQVRNNQGSSQNYTPWLLCLAVPIVT